MRIVEMIEGRWVSALPSKKQGETGFIFLSLKCWCGCTRQRRSFSFVVFIGWPASCTSVWSAGWLWIDGASFQVSPIDCSILTRSFFYATHNKVCKASLLFFRIYFRPLLSFGAAVRMPIYWTVVATASVKKINKPPPSTMSQALYTRFRYWRDSR